MQQESPLSDNESTPHGSPSEKGPAKITRRSHRKSRAGCKNCKTRRVKCDEVKPRCGNCKRRHVVCDFDPRASIISRAHNESEVADSDNLRTSEIELTYHWTTSTCHSLSAWQTGATRWQTVVEDLGLQNEHVLHLVFALTALHLAHCRPNRQDEYLAKADYHYESALAVVTSEIAEIGAHNCDAVLMSVQLICFINWAKGPKPGEFLAFGEHGKSQWLVMFRGIRTTLDHFGSVPFSLTHGPATRSISRPLPQLCAPMNYVEQLSELHEHIAFLSAIGSASEEDILAVNVLKECYDNRYNGIDPEYHVAFAWLYRMPESFLDRLQLREATCLIIYAHFVVLMHDMERFWYMKGWTHHVMGGIFTALPNEHRTWIRWPMAHVGWIPS